MQLFLIRHISLGAHNAVNADKDDDY